MLMFLLCLFGNFYQNSLRLINTVRRHWFETVVVYQHAVRDYNRCVFAGVCHRDGLKRRSYLSSLGSQSDVSNEVVNPETDLVSFNSLTVSSDRQNHLSRLGKTQKLYHNCTVLTFSVCYHNTNCNRPF